MPLSPILPYIYIHINQIKIHFYDTGSLSKWSHLKKKKKNQTGGIPNQVPCPEMT